MMFWVGRERRGHPNFKWEYTTQSSGETLSVFIQGALSQHGGFQRGLMFLFIPDLEN